MSLFTLLETALKYGLKPTAPTKALTRLGADPEAGVFLREGGGRTVFATPKTMGLTVTKRRVEDPDTGEYVTEIFRNPKFPAGLGEAELREISRSGKPLEKLNKDELKLLLGPRIPNEWFRTKSLPREAIPELQLAKVTDESMADLLSRVPQRGLTRAVPARGEVSPFVQRRLADVRERIEPALERGLGIGAHRWYDTGWMREHMDPVDYANWIKRDAMFSPMTSPAQAAKQNSVVNFLERQGLGDIITPQMFAKGRGYSGYGGTNIRKALERYLAGEGPSGQKVTSYHENLLGNWEPVTVDTHINKSTLGLDLGSTDFGTPDKWYAPMEASIRDLARERDLPEAAAQAAIWWGGAPVTGVSGPVLPTHAHMLEELARRRTEQLGLPEEAMPGLLSKVLRGEEHFRDGGLATLSEKYHD